MEMTPHEWMELVADFEGGPQQTVGAFARDHDVDPEEFSNWVKRVRLEGAGAIATREPDRIDNILVAAAELHGELSITQVADAAGVSWRLARKWLDWLVEEGRLVTTGRGRWKRYVLPG